MKEMAQFWEKEAKTVTKAQEGQHIYIKLEEEEEEAIKVTLSKNQCDQQKEKHGLILGKTSQNSFRTKIGKNIFIKLYD